MDLQAFESQLRQVISRRGSLLIREYGSGDFHNAGIMRSTSLDLDPIETKEDEHGETRQVGATIEMESQLLQTEATIAFPMMQEVTSGRVTLILTPRPAPGDTLGVAEARDAGEFEFAGRHLKVGARLRYDRQGSVLPVRMGFRAPMRDLHTFTL